MPLQEKDTAQRSNTPTDGRYVYRNSRKTVIVVLKTDIAKVSLHQEKRTKLKVMYCLCFFAPTTPIMQTTSIIAIIWFYCL